MNLLFSLLLAALIPVIAHARTDMKCPAESLSQDKIVSLQTALFDAMEHEDRATWDQLVAPDFRAFERGKQYNSADFFALIANAHKSGIRLVWSVTEPRVEADCQLAVMSYVNVGSIAAPDAQPKPQRWLEMVMFRRDRSQWRAVLVTSMRAEDMNN